MFQNDELKDHLETSFSVESQSAVVAEWNMNIPGNILKLGNYRYRENSTQYSVLPNFFDINDDGNFYTGATNSDTTVESGFEDEDLTPQLFTYPKDKEAQLYSLEECLSPFRPRSGINKLSYFSGKHLSFPNRDMFLRPRYYMPTKNDEFKYWRSYRTESELNIQTTSTVSNFATINSVIRASLQSSTAVISNLSSVAELPVGKVLAARKVDPVSFGSTAIVGGIVQTLPGNWTATLINLASTSQLRVGDQIAATAGTGSLAGGTPIEVFITAITGPTSVAYRVVGGTGPTEGTVTGLITVPGDLTLNKVRVLQIIDSSTIIVEVAGTTNPKPGTIRDVYINKFNINSEYGISKNSITGTYPIEDCNPFVAYKELVPANRIVLKVQTNVGSIDLGPFKDSSSSNIDDPFFGDQNKTVPKRFKVQYLDSNSQWLDAYEFNDNTVRDDGTSPVFAPDGYLSLEYGLEIPQEYRDNFVYVGEFQTSALLPDQNFIGTAYLIVEKPNTLGVLKVWNGFTYDDLIPEYKWFIGTDGTYENTHFVTDFTNPSFYAQDENGQRFYREFVWVKGVRLVVETMNTPETPLELIEISPRLIANLSDSLISFDVTKAASDLSGSGLPVGQIMAGIGNINLFDNDNSFNPNNEWDFEENKGSIIAKHINKNIKFVFYEVIKKVKVENNINNYYVPIKTMYSETFPERDARTGETAISLRDFYFHFEALKAPQILITEASLSQAICLLLDSVGFSNYVFKRLESESDPVIPYFFIPPDQSIAETLAQLARATQSAMFFDEFNNFVVMTKGYLFDESIERIPDATIYGSSSENKLANIISIESKDRQVYNAGTVNYTTRYIQRTGGSIAQSKFVDKDYVYLPSLLWEVGGSQTTKTANDSKQDRFALSAVPLNTTLSEKIPEVSLDGIIVNNTFDIGENAYWVARFQGFFYANGEVIRYDAVEYIVSGSVGKVWISSNLEYQKYFSKIPFNGKMYPSGLVRIYAEPFFETVTGITITQNNQDVNEAVRLKVGPVLAHGRGQFGTPVVSHNAGLDPYWSNNDNVRGCEMISSLLYTTDLVANRPNPITNVAATGVSNSIATKSQRNGIIRNFLSSRYSSETDSGSLKTTVTGTIQSSALVFTGPDFSSSESPRDFVSYVHKKLDGAYKHVGTRIRIIGKVEAAGNRTQSVVGGMSYYNLTSLDPTDTIALGGGSAGINLVNPETNVGYYFEIAALTSTDLESFLKKSNDEQKSPTISIENILFYKVKNNSPGSLFGGTPTSVQITAVDGTTSLSYRVVGGTAPVAGTVISPRTVPGTSINLGNATVASITDLGSNNWTAKLTGLSSIPTTLRVGDKLTAKDGAGKLFTKTPESVLVTAINISGLSIDYKVNNGGKPKAGAIKDLKTANTAIGFGEIGIVQDITNPAPGVWDARITALDSTSKLRVADRISASTGTDSRAVPLRLWGGIGDIIVDDGNFVGQSRFSGEENPTVYDLAIEYVDISPTRRDFYLYINQVLVQRVTDNDPIPLINQSVGLFVRGAAKAMFENVYGLSKNYGTNTVFDTNTPIGNIFGDSDGQVNATEALKKYAISGTVQQTYLSGIKPSDASDYSMYFEEFGTILREAAYFNVKYDRAYPALFAKIAPTFNRVKGYTVSGFTADSYGAEFLIFNNTDTVLNLDEKTGNYLRILGIAFTQDTTNSLTVDDYLKKKGNLSDPELKGSDVIESPFKFIEQYEKVRQSRILYGKNDFTLDSLYIQDQDSADDILGWIIGKNIRPRKSVGLRIFSMPILQLGDLVNINYKDSEGVDLVSPTSTKYVVYNINYSKSVGGPEMTVYLSEV